MSFKTCSIMLIVFVIIIQAIFYIFYQPSLKRDKLAVEMMKLQKQSSSQQLFNQELNMIITESSQKQTTGSITNNSTRPPSMIMIPNIVKLENNALMEQSGKDNSENFILSTTMPHSINNLVKLENKILIEQSSRDNSEKYIVSKEEMILTNNVTLMPNDCNKDQALSVFIISSRDSFERRETLRKTWIIDIKNRNISVYFVIALSQKPTDQTLIEREFEKYRDLIQFGFIDHYLNLTLKSIAILRWSEMYCKTYHVLKVDDDVVINSDRLFRGLNQFAIGISGLVGRNQSPVRNLSSKWYMPKEYFSGYRYPLFLSGQAYMISGFKVESLLKGIQEYSGYILRLEDVFITGIIAELAGVSRHGSWHFVYICGAKCIATRQTFSLSCLNSDRMYLRWLEIKFPDKLCYG